jgi:hypothetical protein
MNNVWAAALDAEFWKRFVDNLRPLDTDQEKRMIAALAARTKLSTDFLRKRKTAYLRERIAMFHPGNDAVN